MRGTHSSLPKSKPWEKRYGSPMKVVEADSSVSAAALIAPTRRVKRSPRASWAAAVPAQASRAVASRAGAGWKRIGSGSRGRRGRHYAGACGPEPVSPAHRTCEGGPPYQGRPLPKTKAQVGTGPWRRRIDEVLCGCRGLRPGFSRQVPARGPCLASVVPQMVPRLYFCGSTGASAAVQPASAAPDRYRRVINSVAAARRQAVRAIAWQAMATLLTALACLWQGWKAGAAALVGGAAVLLG